MRTLNAVREVLKKVEVVIRKKDGEYRVNIKGGEEVTAYYTNDLEDAEHTGLAMAAVALQYSLTHRAVRTAAVQAAMRCGDCGSTIAKHHTKLCELAEPGAIRDLPAVPGTQWWDTSVAQ